MDAGAKGRLSNSNKVSNSCRSAKAPLGVKGLQWAHEHVELLFKESLEGIGRHFNASSQAEEWGSSFTTDKQRVEERLDT